MMNEKEGRLLPVSEALERMGIGRTSFYEEVKKGNIATKRFGSKTLVPLASVEQWIEALPTVGGQHE
ncbi:MAG: excisionase family DNA-binding protein [Rickettsiales bacterium]|nr:excisionase family DNA-binding protein [Rickettsiales bacterium]